MRLYCLNCLVLRLSALLKFLLTFTAIVHPANNINWFKGLSLKSFPLLLKTPTILQSITREEKNAAFINEFFL